MISRYRTTREKAWLVGDRIVSYTGQYYPLVVAVPFLLCIVLFFLVAFYARLRHWDISRKVLALTIQTVA